MVVSLWLTWGFNNLLLKILARSLNVIQFAQFVHNLVVYKYIALSNT
jgi:hypothetical protein